MKPTLLISRSTLCAAALAVFAALTSVRAGAPAACDKCKVPVLDGADWKENTISPVTNPIFFEDALIHSEIRPIFAYHRIDSGFITAGGHATVYAIQARLALTDRLALIATEDGYFDIRTGAGPKLDGWLDLAVGLKYALIDDKASNFILTPGLTFTVPTGSKEVFNGRGSGQFNVFTSAEKGFGNFHLLANVGVRVPVDTDAQSTELHYSLHADYFVHKLFIPFVELNGWTILSHGHNLPLDSEGYDVINFGSSNSDHATQMTIGGGFRSRLAKNLDFGFAYEKAVIKPYGLTDDRFTFDMIYRF